MEKLLYQALATIAKYVRTHIQPLWNRNNRVTLPKRLMLSLALPQINYFKMTGFELFFRADNFYLGTPLLPNFPPSEKCKKNITKFFHRLQKIENKLKMEKLLYQALATIAKYVRTHFQPLWNRNNRVTLPKRLMLSLASQKKKLF